MQQQKRFLEHVELTEIRDLAAKEFANAQLHPDRYDVRFRQRFLEHLDEYESDLNRLLDKYCTDHRTLASVVHADDRGLFQLRVYIDRLHRYLKNTNQLDDTVDQRCIGMFGLH